MGVTHSLHLIEPAKFARVVAELRPHPFSCTRDVEEYLDRYHVASPEDRHSVAAVFTEQFEDGDAQSGNRAYADLLSCVATETEWYINKSLNHYGLAKPLRIFPALKPVRFLITFKGWDVTPPEQLFYESGLYGLWSAAFLKSACKTFEQFSTRSDAEQYVATVEWSLWDRVRGRSSRAPQALEAWFNNWDHWEQIGVAIRTTVDKGWALGYAMCP